MIAGYHLSGLALHDDAVAIGELAHLGYGAVAIRPHAAQFHPDVPGFSGQVLRVADAIARHSMQLVVDMDGSFLHDPYAPRGPSLVAKDDSVCDAAREWIQRWVAIADEIGTTTLAFSSGAGEPSPNRSDEQDLERLSGHLKRLLVEGEGCRVRIAIRPHHSDVIGSVAQFERLQHWMGDFSDRLGLLADVGEMMAAGEMPIADRLRRNLPSLRGVVLCDRSAGIHGDRPIGDGDVSLSRIIHSLRKAGFDGPGIVRVEGHSDRGLVPAQDAIGLFD